MTEYDLAQRERIREMLLAYVKEHKIGIPTLAKRITETVHRNPTVPVKTLQRFMKGEVRTTDIQVGFLAQFVQKVSKEDPTPRLGAALNAFYSSQDKIDWAGAFTLVEMQDHEPEKESSVEVTRDQGVWRVKEVSKDRSAHRVCDGALTSSGPAGVMVLRDRLNGLPRMITFRPEGRGRYSGAATAACYRRTLALSLSPLSVDTQYGRIAMRGNP